MHVISIRRNYHAGENASFQDISIRQLKIYQEKGCPTNRGGRENQPAIHSHATNQIGSSEVMIIVSHVLLVPEDVHSRYRS